MKQSLLYAYIVELLGTLALVYFGAGVICVDQMTAEEGNPGQSPVMGHQPGLIGIALMQGFVFTVVLATTVNVSGGYLNPAITFMLWVWGRLEPMRAIWLIGAQIVGAVLAGLCLRFTFALEVLQEAHFGTPHLNPLAYPGEPGWSYWVTAALLELVLTFFLVWALFGPIVHHLEGAKTSEIKDPAKKGEAIALFNARLTALMGGLALTACTLLGYSLTGAATNPARWFGTAFWQWTNPATTPETTSYPWADALIYGGGPVAGAMLASLVLFVLMPPSEPEKPTPDKEPTKSGKGTARSKK